MNVENYSVRFRPAYVLSGILAALGVLFALLLGLSFGPLSVALGFLTGLAPFASWQLILPRLASEKSSLGRKLLLVLVVFAKVGALFGILYAAFTAGVVNLGPFIAGTILAQAGFIGGILIFSPRRREEH